MDYLLIILGVILVWALLDVLNNKHTIKSNFPIVGTLRYVLEKIGPEIRQYFVAGNREERPFHRVWRSYIYASAKGENNLTGFGSDADFTKNGHFFIKTAPFPSRAKDTTLPCAKTIGSKRDNPYRPSSLVNISAMSYGSLGKRATESHNRGAKIAGAYHNTGEGGYSPKYHGEGDVMFHIGTGYFGCGYTDSNGDRQFDEAMLVKLVKENPNIKMIEIKLSQGAKPGKGGILPAKKVTPEIAEIRGVEIGVGVHSPAYHSAFHDVNSLLRFIEQLAENTGLPVGIKSAVGKTEFWKELARKMASTDMGPDFIAIDGGEGGTGAAPAAFADNMSLPLKEGFSLVYKEFQAAGNVNDVFWIASGKLGHPTRAAVAFAMGADSIAIAREVMMSIGCIQAQVCHTGNCPAGIATHKWWLEKGINVKEKSERAGLFIKTLNKDILEVSRASGYEHPCQFKMEDIMFNTSDSSMRKTAKELFGYEKEEVKFKK
jgi:glutamate synthase domain-containing protein 2